MVGYDLLLLVRCSGLRRLESLNIHLNSESSMGATDVSKFED
jgi:hypothetical protein